MRCLKRLSRSEKWDFVDRDDMSDFALSVDGRESLEDQDRGQRIVDESDDDEEGIAILTRAGISFMFICPRPRFIMVDMSTR